MTTNFLSRISRFHVPAAPADVANTSIETAYIQLRRKQPAGTAEKYCAIINTRFRIGFVLLNVIHFNRQTIFRDRSFLLL